MKVYIFAHGRKDAENLSGVEIRKTEKKLGRLEMVIIDGCKKILIDYRENQVPVEEHQWYIRKQNAKKRRKAKG